MVNVMRNIHRDMGLGFPVEVEGIEWKELLGELVPIYNYKLLWDKLISVVYVKPTRFIGHEVKFIRLYFELPLKGLAKIFSVTHAAVKKWENKGSEVTRMEWSAEKNLRLYVASKLLQKGEIGDSEFVRVYLSLEDALPVGEHVYRICLDAARVRGKAVFMLNSLGCEFQRVLEAYTFGGSEPWESALRCDDDDIQRAHLKELVA